MLNPSPETRNPSPDAVEPFGEALPRKLLSALTDVDRKIAALVLKRRGEKQAIPLREIVFHLWPLGREDPSCPRDQARAVKDSIERLRVLAKLKVAGTKRGAGGFYVPANAQEAADYADQCFREGIKRIQTGLLFDPKRDWVKELNGKGNLFRDSPQRR